MRAGTLDRRIALQRKTVTQSPSGDPLETWATLIDNRPASVAGVAGSEQMGSDQIKARQQVEFRIRWSTNVADLSPLDRVIYPVASSLVGDDFTASDWQKTNTSIVAINAVAPDGSATAYQLAENTAANVFHDAFQYVSK